jgi:hypothetical protein
MRLFQKNRWEKWYESCVKHKYKEIIDSNPIFVISNMSMIQAELQKKPDEINISYLKDLEYKLIQDFEFHGINILDCETFNRKRFIDEITDDTKYE